uniref:Origin recognition complex subunit 1 n=1 Tax=Panagrolaimus sp. JU765 TaxID=591449 RepID=A0AC34R9L9_9BILA
MIKTRQQVLKAKSKIFEESPPPLIKKSKSKIVEESSPRLVKKSKSRIVEESPPLLERKSKFKFVEESLELLKKKSKFELFEELPLPLDNKSKSEDDEECASTSEVKYKVVDESTLKFVDFVVEVPCISQYELMARIEDEEKARKLQEKRANHPLMKFYQALHTSATPDVLLGRQQHLKEIEAFIKTALSPKSNFSTHSIYISGVPGTGKTACVKHVVENIKKKDFTYVYVNGLELVQPNHIFIEIYKGMFPETKRVSSKTARTKLGKIFSVNNSKRKSVLLVIDELDMIVTKRQDIVYDIFDWAATEGSKLAVISIANTLDLPERLLKQRVSSRLGFNRLVFEPYNHEEIEKILNHRVKNVPLFKKGSISLVSRKVASVSGDLRKALELMRRAIEIAVDIEAKELELKHVDNALKESQKSLPVLFTKTLSKHQEVLLRSVVQEFRSTGFDEVDFRFVYRNYRTQCSARALEALEMTDSVALLDSLKSSGFIEMKGSGQVDRKITLTHSVEEVESIPQNMLASRWLLTVFGLLLVSSSFVLADDPVDGEIKEEGEEQQNVDEDFKITSSPDAQVSFLFTQPSDAGKTEELVAGKVAKFLIGFANRGEKDFHVHFSQTSFRYPMDFSYHVQNFTAARYMRTVPPKQEATFDFAFIPHESFIGRHYGLVVELHYSDADNVPYVTTVFNSTVLIQEDESAFNPEYYFLFLTGIGFCVLLLMIGQNLLSRFTRKQTRSRPTHETGTNGSDLDFEWIPKELVEKKSPKQGSPRQRRPAAKAN